VTADVYSAAHLGRNDLLELTGAGTPKYNDRALMEMAIKEAEKSTSEDQVRVHPKVGAVIARDGHVLATGYRGEAYPGAHAEESALVKLKTDQAMGSTVYSTLEPCTTRGKTPCSLLLIKRGVKRLVYGMLDPNPDIRGQGEWLLEDHQVEIAKFPPDLVQLIKIQNTEFIDYMLGLGLSITYPGSGARVGSPFPVRGIFRVFPRPGDRIRAFGRVASTYYLQAPIHWDRENKTWTCPEIFLTINEEVKSYGIVVARISEDLEVWVRSYTHVHERTQAWVGAEMTTLPPGFEILASVDVIRSEVVRFRET
jgi:pyrimidine deaminase RibD-like protein